MAEQKLFRWYEDQHEPNQRCQAVGSTGQCPFLKMEGANNCARHGGVTQVRTIEKEKANAYRLQVWQNRVDELAEDERVKTLRGEIGILRLTLEQILSQCKNANDLILYSSKISDLVVKIEKLVVSCDKMEVRSGAMLDKAALLSFGSAVIQIISNNVEDEEVLGNISDQIMDALHESTK